MRKIPFFWALITILLAFFMGITAVSAQWNGGGFNYANEGLNSPQIELCKDGSCTLEKGVEAVGSKMKWQISEKPASEFIQDIIAYLLGFVSLIAVIYIIWAGFNVLTGNGDDKKLEDAKKTILYVIIGMIMIWLAYPIVKWALELLDETAYHDTKKEHYAYNIIPTAHAQAYTESELGTFAEYKNRVQVAIEELEAEMRVNKKVSTWNITKVKSLVQSAFERLPDKNPEAYRINESNKRAVDMYLDMAMKTPDSIQEVGNAISQVANFINNAKIDSVKGSISANPTSGNAPLTVSFLAQNVVDPSGTIPPANNYIWWIRENGGVRRELGRGPSLTQTFTNEGTYTVNLDVISASKNSKGRTDVLPLSTSVNIEVKPKIGEITLLVNGINVSNLSTLKLSPAVAAQGLIFDATASRAIGNGRIMETNWDFGNGNKLTYKTAPSVERQIFATSGKFPVKLNFKTNDGQTFSKDIELIIVDPAATIKVDKTTTHVGESVSFTAETHLGDLRNVEYLWTIQDENGKKNTRSSNGMTLSHTFTEIGSYVVTLTAKSPNGGIDNDSKLISVESRDPVAALDNPTIKNPEHPNVFTFDASRSYDPDTNTRDGLTYSWRLNNQPITLDSIDGVTNNSKGTLTFENTGENVISVTVANKYGKIATAEQKFSINSVLSGNLIVTPQVTKVNEPVNFIVRSKNAQFFTWNMGDGTTKSGNDRTMQHSYKNTGTYTVTLTLQGSNQNETTTLTRKVYVSNMDSPFGIINFQNSSNSAILEKGVCDGKDAYVLKRGENTTISGQNSVNVDGSNSNLDYTWRFMGKVSTLSTLNETFKDLGCFPIQLTVKSKTNGASHTTTEYIKLENQAPQITNITTNVDASKKDSQKLIVNVTANGVSDPDGVITSYIWYYTTDSDKEPQSLQITQKPQMTFVLPNVSEKYHFGVIIEDNDGTRINSSDVLKGQSPLIIDNENGNIHMPLITLNIPSKIIKVGQKTTFSADAKTIMGTNVTNKSQYSWDFDGDGRIDEKTSTNSVTHTYTKAGDYNVRVRVTNNGVSNTKYHSISVRNELKASVQGFKIPGDKVLIMNTSQGAYDKAKWTIGEFSSSQLESIILEVNEIPEATENGSIGTLLVSSNDTDISQVEIILKDFENVEAPADGNGIIYQSFPRAVNDTITIKDPSEKVKISMYGNTATNFAIDSNTDLDTDGKFDGITDNDVDNRETSSYTDGSVFVISDFEQTRTRERKVKLTLYNGTTPIATKTITLVFDFIVETNTAEADAFSNIDNIALSEFEKEKLQKLAELIRGLPDSARIVTMQEYNVLVENWDSTFERAKNLVDIQLLINDQDVDDSIKEKISTTIDELLVGEATSTNAVTVATTLIKNLLPTNSANYNQMVEKIDAIASHPSDREKNRQIGQELLVLIQQEPSENLADNYKSIIRQQLKLIVSSGEDTSVEPAANNPNASSSGGIMGTLGSIGKIFLIIVGVLLGIGLLIFIYYKISNKWNTSEGGFQDYVIDKFANKETKTDVSPAPVAPITPVVEEKKEDIDPLKSYTPPTDVLATTDPLANNTPAPVETNAAMPSWLSPTTPTETTSAPVTENTETTNGGLPDWLKPADDTPSQNFSENNSVNSDPFADNAPQAETQWGLPSWLGGGDTTPTPDVSENPQNNFENISESQTEIIPENNSENNSQGELPDWLKPASTDEVTNTPEISQNNFVENNFTENISESQTEIIPENNSENNSQGELPDWLANTETSMPEATENNFTENISENNSDNLPDWLRTDTTPASENNSENENSYSETIQENMPENNFTENNSENIENNSDNLPDWLKEEATPEVKTENTETTSLPDWLDDTQNETIETPKIEENTDNIDPFASFESKNDPMETPSEPTMKINQEFSYTQTKSQNPDEIIAPSNIPAIPSWIEELSENTPEIKNNISETTTSTNLEAEKPQKTEKKPTQKAEKPKKENSDTQKTEDTPATNDLPEWLK